jgi:GNAT superfamily N-acetyltransferase
MVFCSQENERRDKMQSVRRLAELTQDWKYLAWRDGWRSAASEVTRAVVTLPYHHMKFAVLACSLLHPLPNLQPKIPLNIREFEPADVELVRDIDRPSEARSCARRLACGHMGFLALHDGEPAGYAWGCTDTTLERVRLKLASGDVLCTDAYTAPAFRGRGVHTVLTLARFRRFSDLGYRRAISYIEIDNRPSLAVWRKFGSQIIGYIDFKRFGTWRWVRRS